MDVKPDNILVNRSSGSSRFGEAELGDCGDVYRVDPKGHVKLGEHGHAIGAAIFRSPEALLNLRWGAPTDIWSFGTTVSDLIRAAYLFTLRQTSNICIALTFL